MSEGTRIYIKRLSIDGLKGAPVSYDFDDRGRVVVVGPNGGGKTRVADAVHFVLGRPIGGESVDGKNLRAALAGDVMDVTATFSVGGRDVDVKRVREAKGRTFGRSKLYIDGTETDESGLTALLGDVSAPAGSEWIAMSDARLLSALAAIGAKTAPPSVIADVLEAVSTYDGGRLDDKVDPFGAGPDVLDAALAAAKGEVNEAKADLRAASKTADASRSEVGAGRTDPAEVTQLKQAVTDAQGRVQSEAEALSSAKEVQREAIGRRDEAARRQRDLLARLANEQLAKKQAAELIGATVQPVDISAIEASMAEARAAYDTAAAARDEAGVDGERKHRRFVGIGQRLRDETHDVTTAQAALEGAERRAGLLDDVPCTACPKWNDFDDPFVEPQDLASACPLLAEAKAAKASLDDLRASLEWAKARHAETTTGWSTAMKESQAAEAECNRLEAEKKKHHAAVRDLQIEFDRAMSQKADAQRRANAVAGAQAAKDAAEKRIAELEAEANAAAAEVEKLGSVIDEAQASVDAAAEALQAARIELDQANEAHRAAIVRHERIARYHRDRGAVEAAEARVDAAKALLTCVTDAQDQVREAGEQAIIGHASTYVPDCWEIAFVDGAIGLADRAGYGDVVKFWSGAGLSTAQREILSMAIDRALEVIGERKFRVAFVEADPIDLQARQHVLTELGRRVDSGDVSQAFVMQWSSAEQARAAGWQVIELGGGAVSIDDSAPAVAPTATATTPTLTPTTPTGHPATPTATQAVADGDPFAEPAAADDDDDPFADPEQQGFDLSGDGDDDPFAEPSATTGPNAEAIAGIEGSLERIADAEAALAAETQGDDSDDVDPLRARLEAMDGPALTKLLRDVLGQDSRPRAVSDRVDAAMALLADMDDEAVQDALAQVEG